MMSPRRCALVWGGPETVIAVSSDLSHFLDRTSAETIDADTARRIETLDARSLDGPRACGFLPIKGALRFAAERDMRVSGLHLATSADVGRRRVASRRLWRFRLRILRLGAVADADRELLLSAACRRSGTRPGTAAGRNRRA